MWRDIACNLSFLWGNNITVGGIHYFNDYMSIYSTCYLHKSNLNVGKLFIVVCNLIDRFLCGNLQFNVNSCSFYVKLYRN